MEIVGGVASVITIAEVCIKLVKGASLLTALLQDAPAELAGVRRIVTQIAAELDGIRSFSIKYEHRIDQGVVDSIMDGLGSTEEALVEVQDACKDLPAAGDRKGIMKWALFKKQIIKKHELRLGREKSHLNTQLNLLILRNQYDQAATLQSQNTIIQAQNAKLLRIEAMLLSDSIQPVNPVISNLTTTSQTQIVCRKSWLPAFTVARSAQFLAAFCLQLCGVSATLISSSSSDKQAYFFSGRFTAPGMSTVVRKAIAVDFGFNVSRLTGWSLRSQTHIHVFNIVPENAEIMTACAQGNIDRVRFLFNSGAAHLLDVTVHNRSPLWYAIESGNTSLVTYLVQQDRSLVNLSFGLNSLTPLQSALYERNVDMIRALLRYGADADHIDANGFSALFYIWAHSEDCQTTVTNTDLLQVFSTRELEFDLSHQDIYGWTALERAVESGTDDELTSMMRLSHTSTEPDKATLGAIRAAAALAITQNMYSKFLLLMSKLPDVDEPLFNGWTLLEVAAYHGRDDITRHLLGLGAEEFWFDEPYFPNLEQDTANVVSDLSASEESQAWTVDEYSLYFKALIDHGRIDLHSRNDGFADEEEIFWTSNEVMDQTAEELLLG